MKKYKIVAIIGPAGAGKDSLARDIERYLDKAIDYHLIISLTTRPKRDYEVEGEDYYFVDNFNNYQMLETSSFNGWHYGTALNNLRPDVINIGVFNPEGVRSLMKHPEVEVIPILIKASDKVRLIRQLNRESEPNIEEIFRRWKADKEDFSKLGFDYFEVINETDRTKAGFDLMRIILQADSN